MDLTIPLETVCRIVLRAREWEALVPDTDPDEASSPTDDRAVDVLEDDGDNPVEDELRAAIGDLAEDEARELMALALVGRGSFDKDEWDEALEAAADEGDAADFLLGLPMLSAYLETGLAAFDLDCDGVGTLV